MGERESNAPTILQEGWGNPKLGQDSYVMVSGRANRLCAGDDTFYGASKVD